MEVRWLLTFAGTVRQESLLYHQFDYATSTPEAFYTSWASCDAGPKQANIQRGGDHGNFDEGYCSEGDGTVIGNGYH